MVVWRQPSVRVWSEAQASLVDAWSDVFKSPGKVSCVLVLTWFQHRVAVTSLQSPDLAVTPSISISFCVPSWLLTLPSQVPYPVLILSSEVSNVFPPARTLEKFWQGCAWLDSVSLCCFENEGTIILPQLILQIIHFTIGLLILIFCHVFHYIHPRLREMFWW